MFTMTGSMEARQLALRDAVRSLLAPDDEDGDFWVCVNATFPDHVYVTVGERGEQTRDFKIPYAVTADGIQLGSPQPAELTVVEVGSAVPADQETSVLARTVLPLVATITAAADRAQSGPDMQVKALDAQVLPAVRRLLDALAVKGMAPPIDMDEPDPGDDPDAEPDYEEWGSEPEVPSSAFGGEDDEDDAEPDGDADDMTVLDDEEMKALLAELNSLRDTPSTVTG